MDIAIIDYGIGNLRSAEKAFQHLGLDAHLTTDPRELDRAKKVVLPGVGAFGGCMSALRASGFVDPLLEVIKKGTPLLGICVGLQMLFEGSEETADVQGLGLLKGRVIRFDGAMFRGPEALKIPQIGWNSLAFPRPHALFKNCKPGNHVYFVHSFYAKPDQDEDVIALSDYGGPFCCAAARGNVMGVQFHPEKSQANGLNIIKNFGAL